MQWIKILKYFSGKFFSDPTRKDMKPCVGLKRKLPRLENRPVGNGAKMFNHFDWNIHQAELEST